MKEQNKILIYGYGNPGRQDDGLGCFLSEMIEKWAETESISWITCDSNYQLNIEDSHNLTNYQIVIFADASKENIESFVLDRVNPSFEVEFSMHSVSPSYILYLCEQIYGQIPFTGLLHIKGYEWELKEGLTEKAAENLSNAFEFLKTQLLNQDNLIAQLST